jgi:arginine-tRNA-protein transferase
MFAQVHFPDRLSPEELDQYLEEGWFRMGQTIFTTNFLNFKNQFYSAIWLRIILPEFSINKTQQSLVKRNCSFRTEIQRASINPVKEELFKKYREGVSFQTSSSLHQLLFGSAIKNVYDSYEVNIYDDDKLIAVGVFDLGKNSAAGITSFYDPAYKKHSLGKYLIYLKINYCRTLGLQFFYPGYFVPGYALFDYKLEIGKSAQQYLKFTTQQWLHINSFSPTSTPFQVMLVRLLELKELLIQAGIECALLKYEYFDANLIPELFGLDVLDFPLFLYCNGLEESEIQPMIVFDVEDEQYHVIRCHSVWTSNNTSIDSEIFSSHLLKIEDYLFSTDQASDMVATLLFDLKLRSKNF